MPVLKKLNVKKVRIWKQPVLNFFKVLTIPAFFSADWEMSGSFSGDSLQPGKIRNVHLWNRSNKASAKHHSTPFDVEYQNFEIRRQIFNYTLSLILDVFDIENISGIEFRPLL